MPITMEGTLQILKIQFEDIFESASACIRIIDETLDELEDGSR